MTDSRRLPLLDWLPGYQKAWIRHDVVAGLTAAAIVIPKAMAFATIAGLPIEVGLYTSLIPMVIYAILGSSRPLSVSTTTTISILTAAELAAAVPNGDSAQLLAATAAVALLVGAILAAAAVLRLGFVANFISEPVLIGFKAGIGLVIVLDQLPKLLGIHYDKGRFFQNIVSTVRALPEASIPTVAVGLGTILLLVALEYWTPKLPAPLVAAAVAITALAIFGLDSRGVATVGHVPQGLPTLVHPDLSLFTVLWPGAMGIALMSFTESVASARAFAAPGDPPFAPNRDLLAIGLANAGGAMLGAMPAGGGASQTAVNSRAGAKTQLSELVTAATTLLTMLFLAGPMGLLPQPTLAGIVIVYSVGLIAPASFKAILKVRRMEFFWAVAAVAGVIALGTLKGILVAIVISMLSLAQQAANPRVWVLGRKPGTNVFRPRSDEHPEDETFPGLLLLRVEGRVFFVNAPRIAERIRPLIAEARPKVVILDLSAVPDLEYTALKALIEAEERQRALGVATVLVGLTPAVLEVVQRSSLGETLGTERMMFTMEMAVARFQAQGAAAPA
ncbi:MAG TPA: SulP family inorganic anion transporter [Gemmatimonadales bacterium]|nr:SulP family inorganic anion transporter [Gemmatimonadales bacterium]